MTLVKICGLTSLDDARYALEAGADLLGFILYPKSPRFVRVEQVVEIVAAVRQVAPQIVTVGVFVNETPEYMLSVLDAARLDLAQLSGDEPPDHLRTLNGRAYKAVRQASDSTTYLPIVQSSVVRRPSSVNRPDLHLDANHPTLYGGSGMRADESLAATLARQCRLLLAGGLTPDNVASAIQAVRPWGVDVSSGVEAWPGKKDHAKVRAFIAAAKGA